MEHRVVEELVRLVDRSPEQLRLFGEFLSPLVEATAVEDGVQFGDELGGVSGPGPRVDESFVIELSLPLPVFDRNQGAIAAAKSAYRQAELQYRAGRVQLTTQLRQALRGYVVARQSTETYRSEVVPGAQRAFDLVKRSYEAGEIDQLELLDAQQSLIEAELAYIDNLTDLRQAQADLQGLTFTTAGNGTTQRSE